MVKRTQNKPHIGPGEPLVSRQRNSTSCSAGVNNSAVLAAQHDRVRWRAQTPALDRLVDCVLGVPGEPARVTHRLAAVGSAPSLYPVDFPTTVQPSLPCRERARETQGRN